MMWISVALICIMVIGGAVLFWKTRADTAMAHKALAKIRGAKVEALEAELQKTRQKDHDKDVEDVQEVADSGDLGRVLGFVRDRVRKIRAG